MREEKQLLLDEIKGQIDERKSFVIMSYIGLKASVADQFRREIADLGGNVEVVKKRILVKAAHEAGIELELESLPGHIGLVFAGKDAIQTTKAVFQLKKDTNKTVDVIGGHFDGQLYNAKDVETLSNLPGKDEMRAQLLGLFEAPQVHLLGAMQSLLCSILYCLENKSKEENKN